MQQSVVLPPSSYSQTKEEEQQRTQHQPEPRESPRRFYPRQCETGTHGQILCYVLYSSSERTNLNIQGLQDRVNFALRCSGDGSPHFLDVVYSDTSAQ